jgi:hypothetical protein
MEYIDGKNRFVAYLRYSENPGQLTGCMVKVVTAESCVWNSVTEEVAVGLERVQWQGLEDLSKPAHAITLLVVHHDVAWSVGQDKAADRAVMHK